MSDDPNYMAHGAEKFLEGALEATATPWSPPDFTIPAEDFDRVVEALDNPQPTPPEILAQRDLVFEKLGKPVFREDQRDDLGATIDWCRDLLTQHVPDRGGKHCLVCCLRLPCDHVELAQAVLYLHDELEKKRAELDALKNPETWGVEDTGVVAGMTFSTEAKAQHWIATALPGQSGWHAVPIYPGDGRRMMLD